MFVKVVIILNLLFIWNASAFFDNTDIKNKKITYIYHPQPHQKVRLVVGVTEDVFDYYIKKLMTSKDPIADYEEFLSSRCAVSKPKDDIYTVFKLALRVLVEDKNTDPKLYRFLLGRSEALRGYPLTKNWTQKRQGGDPDVVTTFYKNGTNGEKTSIVNHAILKHPENGTLSIAFGAEVLVPRPCIDSDCDYRTNGLDDPEFQITISQQVLEEKKYDTEIESYINILTLKSDDHVNTFSRSTDDQRSANLKEIKSVLSRKVGCSQDILSSELSRNLMEVASIPNSPKFFDLYVTRMVLPNLNKLYPGSNTRKEACYSLVQSSIPLTSIMKLMEKYGTESVLNYAEKLQGLTGVYIGVDGNFISILETYMQNPALIENNLGLLKLKGMNINNLNFRYAGADIQQAFVDLVKSPRLKEVLSTVEATSPETTLFNKNGDTNYANAVIDGDLYYKLISPLLKSDEYTRFVNKYPSSSKPNFSLLANDMNSLKESGKLEEYYRLAEVIYKNYPSALKDTDAFQRLVDMVRLDSLGSDTFDDNFFQYIKKTQHENLTIRQLADMNKSYQNPSMEKISEQVKDPYVLAKISKLNKKYGIPVEDLEKCKDKIEEFNEFMYGEGHKNPKKIFDIICASNANELEKKYADLSHGIELFSVLGQTCKDDDLERTISWFQDNSSKLVQIREDISRGTGFDFRYRPMDKEYLLKFLALDKKGIDRINAKIKEIYRKKSTIKDEQTLHDMAIKAVNDELDHHVDGIKTNKIIALADFIKENLCSKKAIANQYVKDADIYSLIDKLLLSANGDERQVKLFLQNIKTIGIKAQSGKDLRKTSSLVGNKNVSAIAGDKIFLAKLRDRSGEQSSTIANWGMLETLYNTPSLQKIYFATARPTLVKNIKEMLKSKIRLKRKEDSEGDANMSSVDLTTMERDVNYLNLMSIKVLLDFISDNKELIAKYLLSDFFDKRTEHGGLFSVKDSKIKMQLDYDDFTKFFPSASDFDGRYVQSEAFAKVTRNSICSFHFHAVADIKEKGDLSSYSGPSGISMFGGGDLSVAINSATNDVVFTLAGVEEKPGKLTVIYNAVWYGPGGEAPTSGAYDQVELGVYMTDITIAEFEKIQKGSSFKPVK